MTAGLRGWLLLLFAVLALAAVSPYLLGRYVANQLVLASGPAVQIKPIERGWMSSEFTSQWDLQGTNFTLQHELGHGPLPLDWLQPAAASLQTVLAGSECLKLSIKCNPSQPPTLDSLLYWNGASVHQATISLFQTPLLSLHGLHAELQLPSLANSQAAYAAGGLEGLSAELQIQAERIIYTDLTLTKLQGNLQLTGTGHLVNARSHWQTEALRWQDQKWSDLNLLLQAERLDAVLLLSLLNRQWSPGRLLALQDWLQQNPTLHIEQLSLDGEKLNAQGYARLRPVNVLRLLRRPDFPGALTAVLAEANLQLRAERKLTEQLLALWLRGESNETSLQQARQQLHDWSQAGFVRLQNNHYHAHLSFENNQFISY